MNDDAFEKILKISEEFYGTASDPDQMPVSKESALKLQSIHPDTIAYKLDKVGNPIAWVVVLPTSLGGMTLFLSKQISERELFEKAVLEKKFEALYLCGAFVLPEYRRQGHARELTLGAISKLSSGKILSLYSWIYSDEGAQLISNLSKELGRSVVTRHV